MAQKNNELNQVENANENGMEKNEESAAPVSAEEAKTETKSEEKEVLPPIPEDVAQQLVDNYKIARGRTEEESENALRVVREITDKYNTMTRVFEENGKMGMKDILGKVIVPAAYDDFAYTYEWRCPMPTIPALRDGKYGVVKTDGTGEELTPFVYDELELLRPWFYGFLYKKDGSDRWGIMMRDGTELTDCIIDMCYEPDQSFVFVSDGKMGIWQYENWIIPPIYDDIDIEDEPQDPILFTLNGVKGYVSLKSHEFVPKEQLESADDDEYERLWDGGFMCFEYI